MKWRDSKWVTKAQREALIRQEAQAKQVDYDELRAKTVRNGVLNLKGGRRLIRDERWYLQSEVAS